MKAHALDLQVEGQELKLLLERDLLRAGVLQGETEEVAQSSDHAVGRVRVAVQEGGDGVERVEEEVRMELHLEGFELRLRELRLEPRRAQLALAEASVVAEDLIEQKQQPVDAVVLRRVIDDPLERRPRRVVLTGAADEEEVVDDVERAGDDEDEAGGEEQVEQEAAQPALALQRVAIGEPEHEDGARRPEVRVDELLRGCVAPCERTLAEEPRVVELPREEEGEHRPDGEDDSPAREPPAPQALAARLLVGRGEPDAFQSLRFSHLVELSCRPFSTPAPAKRPSPPGGGASVSARLSV